MIFTGSEHLCPKAQRFFELNMATGRHGVPGQNIRSMWSPLCRHGQDSGIGRQSWPVLSENVSAGITMLEFAVGQYQETLFLLVRGCLWHARENSH